MAPQILGNLNAELWEWNRITYAVFFIEIHYSSHSCKLLCFIVEGIKQVRPSINLYTFFNLIIFSGMTLSIPENPQAFFNYPYIAHSILHPNSHLP